MDRIPVCFDPRMIADAKSFSPSAGKPGLVVDRWHLAGFPIAIRTPRPADADPLSAAHHPAYAVGVLEGHTARGVPVRSSASRRARHSARSAARAGSATKVQPHRMRVTRPAAGRKPNQRVTRLSRR